MAGIASKTPGENRLPALDGVRGLAILLVMELHFWGLIFAIAQERPSLVIDRVAKHTVGLGWVGVDLFFVLSGFLITGVLYDTKSSGGFLRTFYARRFLRLAPVYYLYLLFVLFLVPFIEPINAVAEVDALRDIQWWMWSYTINIGSSIKPFGADLPYAHGPFWSLAVEEQFYLVWPFAVLALARRPLMMLCAGMIVVALAFRVALTFGFYESIFDTNAQYVLMPARMDTLAMGALVALAARGTELPALSRVAPAAAGIAVAVLGVLFVKNLGLYPTDADTGRLGFTALGVLFAAFLVMVLHAREGSPLHRVLTLAPLRAFGKYSYAMYAFHVLTSWVLLKVFLDRGWMFHLGGSQIPLNIVFAIVGTATTFGLAWMSWQLIEQPLLRLKGRLPYGGPSPEPVAAAASAAAEGVR